MIHHLTLDWKSLSPPLFKEWISSDIAQWLPCWIEPRGQQDVGLVSFHSFFHPHKESWVTSHGSYFCPYSLNTRFICLRQKSRPSTKKGKQFRKEDLHTNCMCECSWNSPVTHIAILEVFYLPSKELRNLMAANITTRPISVRPQTERVLFSLCLCQILNGCSFIPLLI